MRARNGFTLVEILVTLVLLGLLVGVVLPAVMSQLGKGDNTRLVSDLEGVRSGAKLFRIDVKRYPSTIEQLSQNPCETDPTVCGDWTTDDALPAGTTISVGLKQSWAGPYVEGVETTATDSVATALGGFIRSTFVQDTLAGVPYLAVAVSGLTADDILAVDAEFDDGDGITAGRIQQVGAGSTTDPYVLRFLAVPLN